MFRGVAWLGLVLAVGGAEAGGGAQPQRICADLCSAGLGGAPCGAVCFDLMPGGIPLQSHNDSGAAAGYTRRSACPVLCANRLGYPLCQCEQQQQPGAVDFLQVCEHYCGREGWQVRGCPACGAAAPRARPAPALGKAQLVGATSFQAVPGRRVDWAQWCRDQCSQGHGGSACNCDILPFSLHF